MSIQHIWTLLSVLHCAEVLPSWAHITYVTDRRLLSYDLSCARSLISTVTPISHHSQYTIEFSSLTLAVACSLTPFPCPPPPFHSLSSLSLPPGPLAPSPLPLHPPALFLILIFTAWSLLLSLWAINLQRQQVRRDWIDPYTFEPVCPRYGFACFNNLAAGWKVCQYIIILFFEAAIFPREYGLCLRNTNEKPLYPC